jgi:hypothetical protein
MTGSHDINAARALLHWYAESGVDEAVLSEPASFFARNQPLTKRSLRRAGSQLLASAQKTLRGRSRNSMAAP